MKTLKKAFTLIELLVVIVIIVILAILLIQGMGRVAGGTNETIAIRGPVNDFAKVLSDAQAEQLRTSLLAQEKATSNQIVILTVASLNGEEIEPFANRVFQAAKLGQAGKDNGVLIVLAPKERKMRIEVGSGLEGSLTDAIASQIIRNEMAPRFKANDFAGGFSAAVNAIQLAIKGEYKAEGGNVNFPAGGGAAAGGLPWWGWTLIVLGVIILLLIILYFIPTDGGGSALGDIATTVASIDIGSSDGDGDGGGWSGGGGVSGGGGASGGY